MKKWIAIATVVLGAIAVKAATVVAATTTHTGKCPLCWLK
jgi:hypothetical protein